MCSEIEKISLWLLEKLENLRPSNKMISIEESVDSLPDRTTIEGYGFSLE
jgi:hypothetical protein